VRPRDGDLDVVAVPPVVRPGAVGGHPHPARRIRHARPAAAEDVEVAALEVGVALAHLPAPRRQVRDPHAVAVRAGQLQRHVRVRPGLPDRPRTDVHCVHALQAVAAVHASDELRSITDAEGLINQPTDGGTACGWSSGYLDLSRELAAVRQGGGGGRHGEEEEDGELGHRSEFRIRSRRLGMSVTV
jgi:hypothetical protein